MMFFIIFVIPAIILIISGFIFGAGSFIKFNLPG